MRGRGSRRQLAQPWPRSLLLRLAQAAGDDRSRAPHSSSCLALPCDGAGKPEAEGPRRRGGRRLAAPLPPTLACPVTRPCGLVAKLDVLPAPIGRPGQNQACRAGQVRRPPADDQDKDQQPRLRQSRDQAFQLAPGLADTCDLAHPAGTRRRHAGHDRRPAEGAARRRCGPPTAGRSSSSSSRTGSGWPTRYSGRSWINVRCTRSEVRPSSSTGSAAKICPFERQHRRHDRGRRGAPLTAAPTAAWHA
jgi:hypothetical protein